MLSSYDLNVPTLVTQPPGKRTNDGFMSATFSARSLRSTDLPLTGPTQRSSGMNETMSSRIVEAAPASTARRPASVVAVAVISTSYFFHVSLPSIATLPVAATAVLSLFSTRRVRSWAVVLRAQTDAVYFVAGLDRDAVVEARVAHAVAGRRPHRA